MEVNLGTIVEYDDEFTLKYWETLNPDIDYITVSHDFEWSKDMNFTVAPPPDTLSRTVMIQVTVYDCSVVVEEG